jgi:hypothetical protein
MNADKKMDFWKSTLRLLVNGMATYHSFFIRVHPRSSVVLFHTLPARFHEPATHRPAAPVSNSL